jgi:protein TonB
MWNYRMRTTVNVLHLLHVGAGSASTHIDSGRTRTAFERRVAFAALVFIVSNRARSSTADAFGRGHRIRWSPGYRGAAEPEDVSLPHWLIVRTVVLLFIVIHDSPPSGKRSKRSASVDSELDDTGGVKDFNAALGTACVKEIIMRWSFWPVSITLHVALAIAAFIVPLLAEVAPPTPAPMHTPFVPTKTVPVPETVIAQAPRARNVAPVNVVAPTGISPEEKQPREYFGPPTVALPGPDGGDLSKIGAGTGVFAVEPPPPPPAPKPAQTLFRPGQGIKEPKRISGLPPEYPAIARSARVQGVVILEAVIDDHGEVGRIKVLRSVPLLDQAAITAVQQWRYTPTLLNGVPVSVLMTITVNFTLQN